MKPILKLNSYINSAIPYAWDDSESWFEFLAKLLQKVNELVEASNEYFAVDLVEYTKTRLEIMVSDGSLKAMLTEMLLTKVENSDMVDYVNEKNNALSDSVDQRNITLVSNLNTRFEEIEFIIDKNISGSPGGFYSTLSALILADPDHSKIYVTTNDGMWVYHNGTTFVAGGVYQSAGLVDVGDYYPLKNLESALQQLGNATTDFVEDTLSPVSMPYRGSGIIRPHAPTGTKYYVGTQNLIDIIPIQNGSYTVGSTPETDQVVIVIIGNKITIKGRLSVAKFFTLSDDTGVNSEYLNTPSWKLPFDLVGGHLTIYDRTITALPETGGTLNIRRASGGNVANISLNNALGVGNFIYDSEHAGLYLHLVVGYYDVEFKFGLGVGRHDATPTNMAIVSPNTEIISKKDPYINIGSKYVVCATEDSTANVGYVWNRLAITQSLTQSTSKTMRVRSDSVSLTIFQPCKNGDYLGIRLLHHINPSTNVDTWVLGEVNLYGVDLSLKEGTNFIREGEWDVALKEVGAVDFIGGRAHGDEIASNAIFIIDGEVMNPLAPWVRVCDRLEVLVNSRLNRCDTPSIDVVEQSKNYVFTKDNIVVNKKLKFLSSLTLSESYVAMLPLRREINNIKVSERAYRDNDFIIEDISIPKTDRITTGVKSVTTYCITGHPFTCRMDVSGIPSTGKMFVSGSELYNKIYFAYLGEGNNNVNIGDVWNVSVKYTFGYGEN